MDITPGTIVKRRLHGLYGLLYWHMGVYVGDGTVVHYNGETKKTRGAVLRRDALEAFAAGRSIVVHAAPRNAQHGGAVCDEALRRLDSEADHYEGRYDFALHNCEDFCVDCYQVAYA